MENTEKEKTEQTESSAVRASDAGSSSEAPEGATGQDPIEPRTGGTSPIGKEHPSCSQITENLEGLTEKVGSLGLRFPKDNQCGSARKRPRKARLAEAPDGASDGGQPQTASGSQQQSLPSTSTGFCSEAPCEAAEQNPDEQIAGETSLIGEEHLSFRGG